MVNNSQAFITSIQNLTVESKLFFIKVKKIIE